MLNVASIKMSDYCRQGQINDRLSEKFQALIIQADQNDILRNSQRFFNNPSDERRAIDEYLKQHGLDASTDEELKIAYDFLYKNHDDIFDENRKLLAEKARTTEKNTGLLFGISTIPLLLVILYHQFISNNDNLTDIYISGGIVAAGLGTAIYQIQIKAKTYREASKSYQSRPYL